MTAPDNREPPAQQCPVHPRHTYIERDGSRWCATPSGCGWNARAALDAQPEGRWPGGHWKDPETGELKWSFPSAAIVPDPELQVAEVVRRAASAPPQLGDAERRRRLLRIQGFVDSFADKHAARNAVSALDAQFLLDELDAAQSALAECRQDRDRYRAKAYELGDAEGKLQDELAAPPPPDGGGRR